MTRPATIRHTVSSCSAKPLYGTPIVVCELPSGQRLQLQAKFRDLAQAERTAAKVLERGTVDISLWAPLTPRPGSAAELALKAEAASYELARRSAEAQRRLAA